MLDRARPEARGGRHVSEYICISCWSSFEVDDEAADQVPCPHCGYAQKVSRPTRTAQAPPLPGEPPQPIAAGAGSEGEPPAALVEAAPAADDPLEAPTVLVDPDHPGQARDDQGSLFAAAEPHEDSPPALPAPAAEPQAGPRAPQELWRLRTPTGICLRFPSLQLLFEYAEGLTSQHVALTHGDGVFRAFDAFAERFSPKLDPLDILGHCPIAGDLPARFSARDNTQEGEAAPPRAPVTRRAETSAPRPRVAVPTATGASAPRQPRQRSARRQVLPTEFAFRTSGRTPLWRHPAFFFVLGAGVAGWTVYYLAWLGLLPGIAY